MNGATEKPTPRQRHRLRQLLLSSVFTAEEAHRASVWLASPGATKERASEVINDALARIKARNNAKKDSENRRAEYHANKDNGEHSPRRFSQDHPPNGDSANGKPATESPPEPTPESAPAPLPDPEVLEEKTIYRINGIDYTDKNEAAEAASKAIFG